MQVSVQQLQARLAEKLAPVYLVSGDEPLQMTEAVDAIRASARGQGYTSRQVLEAGPRFDWGQLTAEAASMSLFADQRIIELRITSGKPGKDGSNALCDYAAQPPADTLLLITMPKLDKGQSASKWFKALQRVAAVVQVWPVDGDKLPRWIDQRLRSRGLIPGPGVVSILAERIEGNLLAAAQEIDKLLLLSGKGPVSQEQLAESVADSARFDVFKLVDSALNGAVARCGRILAGLRAEGTPAAVVLWALSRELRLLCSLAQAQQRGQNLSQAMAGRRDIWERRKPLIAKGLRRLDSGGWSQLLRLCGHTDRVIKGQAAGDPWLLLQDISTRMAGAPAIGRIDRAPGAPGSDTIC